MRSNQYGVVPTWLEKYLLFLQREACYYCGVNIARGYQLDHVIPLSKGGLHDWSNIVLSCRTCNARKSFLSLETFLDRQREAGIPVNLRFYFLK